MDIINNIKDGNPKDAVGTKKAPISTLPIPVLLELGLAMLEGARKYGRHNWRIAGVRASVYYDASFRHLSAFWEGEDIDPDSGLSHVTKAIAGLMVLRDSMIKGNWIDDRPPKVKSGWIQELNKKAGEIIEKYPNSLPPYTEIGLKKDNIIDKAKQLFPKSEEKIFKVIVKALHDDGGCMLVGIEDIKGKQFIFAQQGVKSISKRKIEIGTYVKIINPGEQYTTYTSWAEKYGLTNYIN